VADQPGGSAALSYDPVADVARRYPDWLVADADLGGLVAEVLCPARRVILLDRTLGPEVVRCSLAHAVAHLDLGHTHPVRGHFENREESAANDLAARRLIPLSDYATVLTWTRDPYEIAAELAVDGATLRIREAGFTLADRRFVRRRTRRSHEPA
jgi:hypothetical protein